MITSASQLFSTVKKCSIAFESSNSGGFGGNSPAGMTSRFGMPTACTYKLREKLVGASVIVGDGVVDSFVSLMRATCDECCENVIVGDGVVDCREENVGVAG